MQNRINYFKLINKEITKIIKEKDKLKLKIKELSESKDDDINNIYNENGILNNNSNKIDYEKEITNLKQLLSKYETGKIISEKAKEEFESLKNDSFAQIKHLKAKINQINTINNSKMKQNEVLISINKEINL